jgi:aminomethyltransferase
MNRVSPILIASSPRPRLREPGLPLFQPGVERHCVRGAGAVILHLFRGDRVSVTDREGRQPCEIAAFASDGQEDLSALGLDAVRESTGINRLLAGADRESHAIAAQLRQRNLPSRVGRAGLLFVQDSVPGETVELTVARECIAVFHAAGGPMEVDAQNAPTDLTVVVHRTAATPLVEPPLPEPLADVREELRVAKCTARAYEVKAGEYIQVIDVSGRQCSDFVCVDARLLEKGVDRGFDMTATRTMTGLLYPGPGLYSKFFSTDLQPLVEVVQDTVGRHDSFGLACTARFYEDAGYPGHPSCSENFNTSLEPFGIQPKRGWPCINLFFNTGLNSQNAIFLEDPWSRPGDYVLLRALTDLVCASSACPDDIDATNAWNPTDIHVRIYPAKSDFQRAIAFRMSADSEPRLTRETAFHPRTSALTRNFTEYRGFWLPSRYTATGAVDEYWAAREAAIVMDLSALRKFEVLGPDAETLLQLTCTRNIKRLADLQCVYTALCYESGGMLDDAIVFRLGGDKFRLVSGDEYTGQWLREQAAKRGLRAWVKSSTDQLHNLSVQGPKSRDILKEIVWTAPANPKIDEIGWFHFTIGRIGGYDGTPVIASRTGYTGELGYELFCHPKDALKVWDAVWDAGQPQGLKPLGLEALDMLRIESGLVFGGYEFNDQIDPFEAGIGFTVAVKGNEEFIGREAVLRRKEHPQRVLVGLELEGNETASHGNCVHVGRAQVGVITSGCRSPILKKNIALCLMDIAYSAIGTEVEVGTLAGHQKRIPATVVRFPFYDPVNKRPRS